MISCYRETTDQNFSQGSESRSYGKFVQHPTRKSVTIGGETPFLRLRGLARDFTKVTVRTGMGYKRDASSLVLLSLFLRFARKITNIITLIYRLLILRYMALSWQHRVQRMTDILQYFVFIL